MAKQSRPLAGEFRGEFTACLSAIEDELAVIGITWLNRDKARFWAFKAKGDKFPTPRIPTNESTLSVHKLFASYRGRLTMVESSSATTAPGEWRWSIQWTSKRQHRYAPIRVPSMAIAP
jgi:hypothetical protein